MSENDHRKIRGWVREEIQPGSLLPGVVTGAIMGITETIFAVSLVSLIFRSQPRQMSGAKLST